MKLITTTTVLLGTALSVGGTLSHAEDFDIGKLEYNNSCASCHGMEGKGDGPLTEFMEASIPNVAMLAKNNGGVFPLARVYDVIDGRADVKAHGPRNMPVWGRRYNIEAAKDNIDIPYNAEAIVRARVLAVAEYVHRLQEQ